MTTTDYGISVRQPQPNDIIGSNLTIAALGTAFEASYGWKLLNGDQVLAEGYLQAGGMGVMSSFVHEATVEGGTYTGPAIFEFAGDDPSAGEEGTAPAPIRVPVILVPGAQGYVPYQVVKGDTLSKIARENGWGDLATVENIAAASGLTNPDKIRPGQILRIPV